MQSTGLRPAGRSYLATGSTTTTVAATLSDRRSGRSALSCTSYITSQAEQRSYGCCACSWLPSCQFGGCYPNSHLVLGQSKRVAVAVACGIGLLWWTGRDQEKLVSCDSS